MRRTIREALWATWFLDPQSDAAKSNFPEIFHSASQFYDAAKQKKGTFMNALYFKSVFPIASTQEFGWN